MDDPMRQPAPENVVDRIHAFARDLAYGAAQGLWHTKIQWQQLTNPTISRTAQVFAERLAPKWGAEFPSEFLMLSFGYFTLLTEEQAGRSTYLLTEKAFKLLEKPNIAPEVFISYRRSESSALGLLIEARLKLAGNPNPFLDKNLVVGEEWVRQLEERIRQARYFIILVGKTTLDSPYVMQELDWALEAGCTIISIWHGCRMDDSAPEALKTRHAIIVETESALGYETAVTQLLNNLGYTTY